MLKTLFCSLCLLWLSGCTYHVMHNNALFGHAHITVMPFDEAEPIGLSADLTQELDTLLASSGVLLSPQGSATLKGVVRNASTSIAPGSSNNQVTFYQHHITVDATLENKEGVVLWRTTLDLSELFLPYNNQNDLALGTEANKRLALHRIAQKAARLLHERLTHESLRHDSTQRSAD